MTFFTSTAVAADMPAAGTPPPPPLLMNILPFILIFFVCYLLIIRPQMKKQKEQQAMISSISRGEKIVTAGGIVGTVVKVEEEDSDILHVEIAPNVKVKVIKSTVTSILSRSPQAEKKEEGKSGKA